MNTGRLGIAHHTFTVAGSHSTEGQKDPTLTKAFAPEPISKAIYSRPAKHQPEAARSKASCTLNTKPSKNAVAATGVSNT